MTRLEDLEADKRNLVSERHHLKAQIRSLRLILAAVAVQSGSKVVVKRTTMASIDQKDRLDMWSDDDGHLHIKVHIRGGGSE